jgi:hypothetical protein
MVLHLEEILDDEGHRHRFGLEAAATSLKSEKGCRTKPLSPLSLSFATPLGQRHLHMSASN